MPCVKSACMRRAPGIFTWASAIILGEKYRTQAGEALIKELQNHVKRITAPYKYPRIIEFVEELPKTISGKIRRKEIRNGDEKR